MQQTLGRRSLPIWSDLKWAADGHIILNHEISSPGPNSQWLISDCNLGSRDTHSLKRSDFK